MEGSPDEEPARFVFYFVITTKQTKTKRYGQKYIFTGQPVFAQLCKYLDRDEVLKISTESGGERYRKSFDAWTHLLSMPPCGREAF